MKHSSQVVRLGAVASMLVAACTTPSNMTKNAYTVTPNPLEAKGDTVAVNIEARIPAKSFDNKALVTFQPYLKTSGGTEVALKEYTVGGVKAKGDADQKIDAKVGGKISYSDRVVFRKEMMRSTLYPRFKAATVNVPVGTTALAEGIITTAYLVKASDKPLYNSDEYKAVSNDKSVDIYFPINVDRFNASFKMGKDINNKTQLGILKEDIKQPMGENMGKGKGKGKKAEPAPAPETTPMKDRWVAKGISVNGFASPDGPISINEKLSHGRSQSTFSYFKKELKKMGFAEVNDSNFTLGSTISEDWDGFVKLLEASDLSDKNEIIGIIRNPAISPEDRDAKIVNEHGKSWKVCADKLLPKLRRSELVIHGSNPIKTDMELTQMYGQYDKLSPEETYHLAVLTKNDPAKKAEVLNAYVGKKSDDWRGYSDLGAALSEQGRYDEALTNLDKANQLNPGNGTVLANYGVAYKLKGDRAKAEQYYRDASSKGADVNYHLGILAIQKGNYADAVSMFNKSGVRDFNAALANLLNGDPSTCKNIIDGMNPEELDWQAYYLRSVAGARMNNQDVCTTNLAKAVSMNGEARTRAKEDVEFMKFWGNPLFEAAIR